jgi:hypothetical protein
MRIVHHYNFRDDDGVRLCDIQLMVCLKFKLAGSLERVVYWMHYVLLSVYCRYMMGQIA